MDTMRLYQELAVAPSGEVLVWDGQSYYTITAVRQGVNDAGETILVVDPV